MHMTCPQNQSKSWQWCFVFGSDFPWSDAVELYPWGEVAWTGDLLGLLILISEGKGEWNFKVLIVFGSRYPNCTSWKERGFERGYKSIGKQALLFWLIVDHLTCTPRARASGFSDLFVRASSTVLICSFAHTHKIKILSIHFSLTCFWQSDKQVKNRASS